jgi:CDP-2,3-bis-(O-geranylgeranyl)-sn-glycerol synthase
VDILVWKIFVTAGVANMVASISYALPILSGIYRPVHAQLFGKNKTWSGAIGALLSTLVLGLLFQMQLASIIAIGVGVVLGDLSKSWIKRKRQIQPGVPWLPWDYIDWVLGVNICLWIIGVWKIDLLILLPCALVIHPLVKFISHKLQWTKEPF